MSDELRHRLKNAGRDPVTPFSLDFVEKRARRLTIQTLAVATLSVTVLVAGAFAVKSAISTDAAPVPPVDRDGQVNPLPDLLPNGNIIHAGDPWLENTTPPWPGAEPHHDWIDYDQDSGRFLVASLSGRLIWIVGETGQIGEVLECPHKAFDCAQYTFGPGPDETTVMTRDRLSVQITSFEGEVRDTLDIASIFADNPGQSPAALAWSPDGSRLALSTSPDYGCGAATDNCDSHVWILDRDGGEPHLAYTERATDDLVVKRTGVPNYPTIIETAWSPDGRSLALTSSPADLPDAVKNGVWPRLIALRWQPGQVAQSETLHVYDDYDWEKAESMEALVVDPEDHFAFAWSPDGTRIAVTSKGGIAEVSAEDGRVLARHSDERLHGPLAWLPKQ